MTMKDGSFKSGLFICFFSPFRTPNVNKEIAGLKSLKERGAHSICILLFFPR